MFPYQPLGYFPVSIMWQTRTDPIIKVSCLISVSFPSFNFILLFSKFYLER